MRPWGKRMRRPGRSVIIPTVNSARNIAESVDLVLAQTRRPTEILVIDDDSTDDTRADESAYPDPGIRYVEAQHRGTAAARNAGIGLACAEYLAFLVEGGALIELIRLSD